MKPFSFFLRFLTIAGSSLLIISGDTVTAEPKPEQSALPSLFLPGPVPNDKGAWNVKNLGPVGIGMDLKSPDLTMVVSNVEKGSPAELTGKFKIGQVIESINGQTLAGRAARETLGDIITEAEATDGKMSFKIQGEGDVVVTIPVMGRYSKTWPLNCPKSDKIVRNLADLLAKREKPTWGSVIFMLSTGEEKDLEVVRGWMDDVQIGSKSINWHRGYMSYGVCEYYLRTGDAKVLPMIKEACDELKKNIYNGGWGARDVPAHFTYSTGSGQVHASGAHCLNLLLMARLCGVEVDNDTLQEALTQFYRFAGHGNVAYGEGTPEGGFRDNGKTSAMALGMTAAALLTPDGEKSVYAKARDNSSMKAFYATNWFHAAHTGGGMGEIWHHTAVSQMHEKRPIPYRSYMDTRRWLMDLSRRFDGSIGIGGMTDRYDVSVTESDMDFGTFFALTYTLPRKHLQLFGAPRSKFAKNYQLPPRPWGNAADDQFHSIEPLDDSLLSMKDLLNENVPDDASLAVITRLADPKTPDTVVMKYLHHPEYDLRVEAIKAVVNRGKYELIIPLLESDDPRLRNLGILSITGMFKGKGIPNDQLKPEIISLVERIIENKEESWWVTIDAISALGRFDKAIIAKHRDRLLDLMDHRECTYTKTAAIKTLALICAEPDQYKILLPRLVDATMKIWNNASAQTLTSEIGKALSTASPEVKAFAESVVKKAYNGIPDQLIAKSGAVLNRASQTMRIYTTEMLKHTPGGSEFIRFLPKKTFKFGLSSDEKDMYVYKNFVPAPQFVGKWRLLTGRWEITIPDDLLGKTIVQANKEIEAQKQLSGRSAYRPNYLILEDGGTVQRDTNRFWSGDMLVHNNEVEARRMEARKLDGIDYLLVERGGFPDEPDPKAGYGWWIYIKEP